MTEGTRLLFRSPLHLGSPVPLVFGRDDGSTPPPVTVEGGGRITGLRGHIRARVAVRAFGAGRVTGLRGHIRTQWDANVSRTTRAELGTEWQTAAPLAQALETGWQETAQLRVACAIAWQPGDGLRTGEIAAWHETLRMRATVASAWQEGEARRAAVYTAWHEALRVRAASASAWQPGDGLRGGLVAEYQEALRLRAAVVGTWQEAVPRSEWLRTGFGDAERWRIVLDVHWQEAIRPASGESPVVVPPGKTPCYVPSSPVRLLFRLPAVGGRPTRLVFICEDRNTPTPGIVVPPRRTYIVINSVEIRRADDLAGAPLPSESFQMSLNRQSWTWTFSASFHASARDALMPGTGGQPVELEVRVNGQPFRLQGERIGRSKRFPEHLVTVSGRGKAALLDAPHAPVQTFTHTLDRTAQQLMSEVLTVNGVGFGWAVDFQLTDWLVPGGVWMHQGTYISALTDIAGSVGGYLQPHDTDPVLHALPAWPLPWWRWNELAPDIDLPEGIAEVGETEVIDVPEYNRIFVAGEAGGVMGDLTRAGTAGDVLKQPMAVHPLITTIGAAKARAIAELAESGRQLKHKMTLPVLAETGVIKPGRVLRYYDDAGTRRLGIVRGTSISQQYPVLTQALEVDSHV
ncbi:MULTISPECIES: hypothetical protein [Delftia]|jgi:hypothetical protein|uniref:hypothetical protein n=1 Tax=Delftia TaxID=80865 RepID=UPI0003536701|nr:MULTISPECIES: hypothetical protein [Delftia]EPD34111.1 hypothetical protein HMPREF9701_06303 [Delftia acidovorans CCUG 274B]MCX7506596.1 hypothetical protein [Delftia tsuruhatensis]MDC2861658.1 hypothetical protein [Delftia sp. DT-2]MDR6731199.1 hypothetical protein [Delftia lacustris]TDF26052.1 hypothetical protein EZI45_19515 [Delftia tsuruhatensis]